MTYIIPDSRSANCLPHCGIMTKTRQQGMTLLELTVVLMILVTLATVALRSTAGLQDQARWEQTKKRYEAIKNAIIGDPDLFINGQPDISGFVADMGRLPSNIHELLEEDFCLTNRTIPDKPTCTVANWTNQTAWNPPTNTTLGYGWNGPYLLTSEQAAEADAFTDGWGREAQNNADQNYGWNFLSAGNNMNIQSLGKDRAVSVAPQYDADYPSNPLAIVQDDWLVDINGGISINIIPKNQGQLNPTTTVNIPCDASAVSNAVCTSVSPPWTWTTQCEAPANFLSKNFCINNGAQWAYNIQKICLKISYRSINAGTGNTQVNDDAISTPISLTENGREQLIGFNTFNNSVGTVTNIPIGTAMLSVANVVNGVCGNTLYPTNICSGITQANCNTGGGEWDPTPALCYGLTQTDCVTTYSGSLVSTEIKKAPLPVSFIPHKNLPTINW